MEDADEYDAFAEQLAILTAKQAAPHEIEAAKVLYERMRTSQAICGSLLPGKYSEPAVLAVLKALSDEAQALRRG